MTQPILSAAVFWSRFEAWLADNEAGSLLALLSPGAADAELNDIGTRFGFPFPEEFRAFYQVHNGASFWPGEERLLSLEEGLDTTLMRRTILKDTPDPSEFAPRTDEHGVPQTWWDEHWFSLTTDGGGNGLAVQCGPGDPAGQVVYFDHEGSSRSSDASLPHYLATLMQDLESGWYVVRDNALCARDQLDEDDEDQSEWLDEQS